MARFGFPTVESIAGFVDYVNNTQTASFPNQPDGTLIQRAIELSYDDIEKTLPYQLASRTLGAYMVANNLTCNTYLAPIANNPVQAQEVCDKYG